MKSVKSELRSDCSKMIDDFDRRFQKRISQFDQTLKEQISGFEEFRNTQDVKNNDFALLIQARLTDEQLEAALTTYTEKQIPPCNERIKEKISEVLELVKG